MQKIAFKLRVSSSSFNRLINGKSNVSPVMAVKLSRVLRRSSESRMFMERNFDIWKAKDKMDLSSYQNMLSVSRRP